MSSRAARRPRRRRAKRHLGAGRAALRDGDRDEGVRRRQPSIADRRDARRDSRRRCRHVVPLTPLSLDRLVGVVPGQGPRSAPAFDARRRDPARMDRRPTDGCAHNGEDVVAAASWLAAGGAGRRRQLGGGRLDGHALEDRSRHSAPSRSWSGRRQALRSCRPRCSSPCRRTDACSRSLLRTPGPRAICGCGPSTRRTFESCRAPPTPISRSGRPTAGRSRSSRRRLPP